MKCSWLLILEVLRSKIERLYLLRSSCYLIASWKEKEEEEEERRGGREGEGNTLNYPSQGTPFHSATRTLL